MKKFLTILSLFAVLSLSAPAMAAPHGPGGPDQVHVQHGVHRPPHHGAPPPHIGHHGGHRMPPPPPVYHHRHNVSVGWGVARRGYWAYPGGCDYRLGWYDEFYPYCRPIRVHPGFGVYIGF